MIAKSQLTRGSSRRIDEVLLLAVYERVNPGLVRGPVKDLRLDVVALHAPQDDCVVDPSACEDRPLGLLGMKCDGKAAERGDAFRGVCELGEGSEARLRVKGGDRGLRRSVQKEVWRSADLDVRIRLAKIDPPNLNRGGHRALRSRKSDDQTEVGEDGVLEREAGLKVEADRESGGSADNQKESQRKRAFEKGDTSPGLH